MKKRITLIILLSTMSSLMSFGQTFELDAYGILPGAGDLSEKIASALDIIRKQCREGDSVTLRLMPGRYDFHPDEALQRTYYISNHDQTGSQAIGIALEGWDNLTLDGRGAELVFHGVMIPLAVTDSRGCTVKNLSIDFENPQIAQVRIVENRGDGGIVFKPESWVKYRIAKDSVLETYGEGWDLRPSTGIAFEPETRHILWNTGDIFYDTKDVRETEDGLLAPRWQDSRLVPGTVVAMRTWYRPAPGIFLYGNTGTTLKDVRVHYSFGMGLIAQFCDGITLDGFSVCLKGEDDPRYFTTQADATHFSQCKGVIHSSGGLYEGMMDDAVNVHGIYLKITGRKGERTVTARFMHDQAWGFRWGEAGDSVRTIDADVMEYTGTPLHIESISPDESCHGQKELTITFREPLDTGISHKNLGLENLSRTPEVVFSDNTVRNNRARGALFSSPRRTVVENNVFDHTSGTAILLCGDCNGWYESGACRDVLIRGNRFINALTSMYQFTMAVISIYPEIPDLEMQTGYFHGGTPGAVTITGNTFETFDMPILYAKSIDGLIFKDNNIIVNDSYRPFHKNRNRFLLERTDNVGISY